MHPEGMLVCEEYSDTLVSDNKNVITPTRKSKYSYILIYQRKNKEESMQTSTPLFHEGRNKEEFMKVTTPKAEEHGDPATQMRVTGKMCVVKEV